MRNRFLSTSLSVAVLCGLAITSTVTHSAQQSPPAKVDFATEIQPIFRQHCISCHGPKEQKNGLRLDRRKDAMRGGTIAVIGPGNSAGSRLYHRLTGNDFGIQMPPTGPLPADQVAKIKAWIDQGAEWPDALAGDRPPTVADPAATRIMDLLRAGDVTQFRSAIAADASLISKKGPGGATPLMFASLYGDAATMRSLIEQGADVNATDDSGVTALMWAVTDLEKTKALVETGADVNAQSADGRTPLLIASALHGSAPVVTLLLDRGADIKVRAPSLFGDTTPLVQAAYIGDETTFKLLVERGADVQAAGVLALGLGMRSQCKGCVETMMKALDPGAYTMTMLLGSPPTGPALATPMLLAAGADPRAVDHEGRSALMLAAASEAMPVDAVKALIERGVDLNARSPKGFTALTYARMQGATPVVQLLEKAGAIDGHPPTLPPGNFKPAVSVQAAVTRSLPLLQQTDQTFMKKASCVSCHHNTLTATTVALARARGFAVDETIASSQRRAIGEYLHTWRDRALQGVGIPGDASTVSYILLGLGAEKYPADAATDAMVRFLRFQQTPHGFWIPLATRPPIEGDLVQVTAISMRALQVYTPPAERESYRAAIDRAAKWIASAQPRTNEGRIFQLLGLHWSGAGAAAIQKAGKALLAQQRKDGGWAQLDTLPSDAYATGQALAALAESGAVPATHAAYRRGVQYLLKTQFEDGSWYVRTRALPIQPHFESGFPHGKDQFISAAATNWATIALTYATRKGT